MKDIGSRIIEDTLGRKINYLRISVTDRCNLRCRYCMPEEGICKREHNDMLTLEEIFQIVKECAELGVSKIRITGGEPLVRKDLPYLIKSISGIEGINEIALTTNGILLSQYADELKAAGLNRVNISLDTMSPEKYSYITRGGNISDVMEGIKAAEEAGLLPIKLNTVLIGDFNDDEVESFVQLTMDKNIDVRFIELMQIGQAANWAKKHFISNSTILEKLKDLQEVQSNDPSSPAKYYRLPGSKGRVGLINPISHAFCSNCNRIRMTADGKLKPCLHSEVEIDVKDALRRGERVKDIIKEAVLLKPAQHNLNSLGNKPIQRDMYRIGG